MKITIVITKELEAWWGPEDLATLDDSDIIPIIEDDITSFLENAKWEVKREDSK
jgi:hypothetical protein